VLKVSAFISFEMPDRIPLRILNLSAIKLTLFIRTIPGPIAAESGKNPTGSVSQKKYVLDTHYNLFLTFAPLTDRPSGHFYLIIKLTICARQLRSLLSSSSALL
jgi:hypothetical protein